MALDNGSTRPLQYIHGTSSSRYAHGASLSPYTKGLAHRSVQLTLLLRGRNFSYGGVVVQLLLVLNPARWHAQQRQSAAFFLNL